MKGIQLKRKIFHWEPLKIFPLGIALAPRKGRRPSRYEIPIRGSKFLQDFYGLTIFCILQEQFFGMSSDCQEPIMYLVTGRGGDLWGLILAREGSLSLKAQLALSCMSQKSPRPGIGMLGRSLATCDWEWLVCLVRDIFCETFRFGITALSFLFRKLLWEIQQLFQGTRHDNRAQLVEGERSYFTPGAVYMDISAWIWLFHPKHFKIGISCHFRTSNFQNLSGEQPCNMPL